MSGRLVLLRHGQSHGNVERRLDTRPPGTELTPLGREQALEFARGSERPAMLAHSVAVRASQTAGVIGAELDMVAHEFVGIHEVQVGDLENRSDDEAVAEFNAIYERWHHGELEVRLPSGENGNDVLDRYVPVLTDLRMRHDEARATTHEEFALMQDYRSRLAVELDAAVDRSRALESANAEAVKRLARAAQTVERVLGRLAPDAKD